MNNSDSDVGFSFGMGIITVLLISIVFLFGFSVGSESGKAEGEKKTALITIQALNKIKQQLPKDTKISNPFTQQQLESLSYDAQEILNLF